MPTVVLLSSISFGDMESSKNKSVGLLIPKHPSGQIFIWGPSIFKYLQRTKFQLPSSISFGDMEGVPT